MNDFNKRLVHVHGCGNVSWKLLHRILTYDKTLQKIYKLSLTELERTFHLTNSKARNLYHDLHKYTPDDVYNYYKKREIMPITIVDPLYPSLLKSIYDPPFVLYTLGMKNILKEQTFLAVVGTRNPTELGKKSLTHILPPIIQKNWTIVSGLAKGIDTFAHKLALKYNGHTIAVLGSGFDYIYPQENKKTFTEMSKTQLLITEYPPYVPPRKWHFPARNRIISGLCAATLIIEAKEKSGSLITADQALEQGRDVFAVPGSIFNEQSIGTNRLIQQGAKLILNAEDIMNEIQNF